MIAAIDSIQSSRLPERVANASSVAEQILRRLQTSPYPVHRHLRCSFCDGVLTLSGRVSSYYLRQMALVQVADLEGIEEFVDRIEVANQA